MILVTEIWSKAFKKLPLLEELSLIDTSIWKEDIEVAGRCCPLLKTLKLNQLADKMSDRLWDDGSDDDDDDDDEETLTMKKLPLAIGKSLPGLTHLELIGNYMRNTGCPYNNYVLDDWDSEYDRKLDSESDVDDFANLSFESLREMMAFESIFD
ncbi:putative F-box protein At4g05475 [Bidens hawaiensis]|uniref:putative F-box protein At4g05475 n=1 Tax=Bidens hawaiensis TaxID=980011 RepID=UPI00404B5A2D